jgi:hypothetical protein
MGSIKEASVVKEKSVKRLVCARQNKFNLMGGKEDNQCQLNNAERQDALKFIRNGFFMVDLAGYYDGLELGSPKVGMLLSDAETEIFFSL